MGLLDLRRRSRVLGLPIGPKRVDWVKASLLGLMTLAMLGTAVTAARRRTDALSSLVDTGRKALDSAADVATSALRGATALVSPHLQDGPPRDERGRFVASDDEAEGGLREAGEARERA